MTVKISYLPTQSPPNHYFREDRFGDEIGPRYYGAFGARYPFAVPIRLLIPSDELPDERSALVTGGCSTR